MPASAVFCHYLVGPMRGETPNRLGGSQLESVRNDALHQRSRGGNPESYPIGIAMHAGVL